MPISNAALGIAFGLIAAALALWWVMRRPSVAANRIGRSGESLSFLFENGNLIDASEDAEALLCASQKKSDWGGVSQLFRSRFSLPDRLEPPGEDNGVLYFNSHDATDKGVLEVRQLGNKIRLDLLESETDSAVNSHKYFLLEKEIETLQFATSVSPIPIWQLDSEGMVVWSNDAYDALYREVLRQEPQPETPLFRIPEPPLDSGKTRRVPITPSNSRQSMWFDVQRVETRIGDFFSAVDANAIVRAEAAQRNFVQTLAKTFAHLPIGLAIFDDNRQLVLFNPAVIDLTGLGADFLSARPNLLSFFDELRNRRLMPEPKNYNSWRQQIADLVAAAADGRYSETWTLDSGRTYRVNGRPHPDGAIAFLIEDISAEVSLTRRFRAELELGQSVLDQLSSAIAVFSSSGVLTVSNEAYHEMWGVDPDSSFAEISIIDCLRHWQERSENTPIWGEIRDFVLDFGDRAAWSSSVKTRDGRELIVDAIPLVSGTTMVRFLSTDAVHGEKVDPLLQVRSPKA